MDLAKMKSMFLKVMIGCLVSAASIAVVTVLVGEFNDTLGRALYTILLVAIHALVSFEFIDRTSKQKNPESLAFFNSSTFIVIILSFITSVFGLWQILDPEIVGKLYMTYFVVLFAILHGEVLSKTLGVQNSIDNVVYSNYVLMGIVVFMLLPIIYVGDTIELGGFYYRLLAAAGIIDATLTMVDIIMFKLYLQKHPTLPSPVFTVQVGPDGVPLAPATQPKRGMNIFVVILIIYLVFQVIASFTLAVIGGLNR